MIDGPDIGLHFGMTGRIVVDGVAPIDRLQYASERDDPAWDRLRLFADHGPVPTIRFNDPDASGASASIPTSRRSASTSPR